MKILIAINSDIGRKNAVGIRFAHIAHYVLKQKEFELKIIARSNYDKNLDVICPFYGNLLGRTRKGLKMVFPPIKKIFGFYRRNFDFFVLKNTKEESFDIAHIQSGTPRSLKHFKDKGSKIVLDLMMVPGPKSKKNLEKVDHITGPGTFIKEKIKSYGVKTPVTVIPWGVDTEKFKPRFEKKDEKVRFAFVGAACRRKGTDYLIQAWKELSLENAELHFYGRMTNNLKDYFKNAKKHNIFFHGFVDVSKELPKNNVFVLPSLNEGSAKAIYEALACGLPVITTPDASSIVRDSQEGFLIPARDKEAIKEKILYFYNNPEKIREMGEKGRRLAEEHSWERYAESVYSVYKKVLEE